MSRCGGELRSRLALDVCQRVVRLGRRASWASGSCTDRSGGGVKTPLKLFPALGLQGSLQELLRIAVRGAARYGNPLARLAWRRADLILVQNPETREWLPGRHRRKAEVFPNIVLEPSDRQAAPRDTENVALFAARLLPWKGTSLAVQVIAQLPGWRLILVGSGSDAARVQELASRLDVADRIEFLGQVPRARLLDLMSETADVLLFPSTHEDAGWVVAEAGSVGLPVVALDRGGPPLLGATVVKPGAVRDTVDRLAASVTSVVSTERQADHDFDLDVRSVLIRDMLLRKEFLSAH